MSTTETTIMKPSEVLNFDMVMRLNGDRKTLYMLASEPNKSGMAKIIALGREKHLITSIDKISSVQTYLAGRAADFFDKLQDKLSTGVNNEQSAVLEVIEEFNNESQENDAFVRTYHADLILNFWHYINPFLVFEDKEPKDKKTKK